MKAWRFLLTTIILCGLVQEAEPAQVLEVVDIVLYDQGGNVITAHIKAGSTVTPVVLFTDDVANYGGDPKSAIGLFTFTPPRTSDSMTPMINFATSKILQLFFQTPINPERLEVFGPMTLRFVFPRLILPSESGDYLFTVYIRNNKDEVDSDDRVVRVRLSYR